MDRESIKKDLFNGIKPVTQVCQEYEALLKIKEVTEKEVADEFKRVYGSTGAAMHIMNNFSKKTAKSILQNF